LQIRDRTIDHTAFADDLVRIPGHVKQFQPGRYTGETVRDGAAVHPRHDPVRKQQSNRTIAAFYHSDGLLAMGRRQDFETEVAQQITDEPAYLRLVLDDQNGPR